MRSTIHVEDLQYEAIDVLEEEDMRDAVPTRRHTHSLEGEWEAESPEFADLEEWEEVDPCEL